MATNLTETTFPSTYKDDFADSAGFHKILFNSGKALQARELTQLQTILHLRHHLQKFQMIPHIVLHGAQTEVLLRY